MPTDSAPVPIQVVFQGGGARLCALMAVCEVIEEFQESGKIIINRTAGSSAGAIAAVMLASKRSMKLYKGELPEVARSYTPTLQQWNWYAAWRVYKGGAYFKGLSLDNFFNDLFCKNTKLKVLGDLAIDSEVYFTDLYSLQSRSAPRDEPIPKALAKSCRYPFAFAGFKSGNNEVDGGLSLNLPVDAIKKDESTRGSVIGVAFTEKFGDIRKDGLRSYTQQLFSASIHNGVLRSETILGRQNVFRIDTDIGTFDFGMALNEGFGVHYELVKNQFATWLGVWLRDTSSVPSVNFPTVSRLIRPPLSNVPLPMSVIREIDDRLKTEPATNAISVWSCDCAILDEAGRFNGRYLTRLTMKFNVSRPVHVLQFDFQAGGSFMSSNLGCAAMNCRGESLQFTPDVQELPHSASAVLRDFRVYFYFDKRLTPDSLDQPYIIECQYEADDPYPKLGARPEASVFIRWQGDAQEATLAVGFPREKVRAQPRVGDIVAMSADQLRDIEYVLEGETLVPSIDLPLVDFVESMRLDHPADRYFLVGRKATNVRQGQGFGFTIE
jgi:predicted acylesterase/phospholipase RssA